MFIHIARFASYAFLVSWLLVGTDCFSQEKAAAPAKAGEIVAKLSGEVNAVKRIVSNPWVGDWISTVGQLPTIEPRTVHYKGKKLVVDEEMFYYGRFGSPLAYARALDLARVPRTMNFMKNPTLARTAQNTKDYVRQDLVQSM